MVKYFNIKIGKGIPVIKIYLAGNRFEEGKNKTNLLKSFNFATRTHT